MGILRTTLALTGWGSLGTVLGYTLLTRKSKISPISATDHIFASTLYARYNPSNAPVTQDICVRRVPLSQINPQLLEDADREGTRLVEKFCAGVWSGWGYAYQRRYLEKKYRGPETASQLWDRADLQTSNYAVGTQITDHFEVLAKNPTSIIVRCGDTPRNMAVRASDGLFEMSAEVRKEEGIVEFGLKSVFYNGLAQPDKDGKVNEPMTPWIQWLHQHYDKVLMETAIRECMQ